MKSRGRLVAEWRSPWPGPKTYSTWNKPQHWWVRVEVSNRLGKHVTSFTVAEEKAHLLDLLDYMLEQIEETRAELKKKTGLPDENAEFQVYRIKRNR